MPPTLLLPGRRAALAALAVLTTCACNGSGLEPVTVSGFAIGNDLQPAAGAQVKLTSGSFAATVAVDARGTFTVASVPRPYDALLIIPALAEVTVYRGLTRADPTLVSLGSSVPSHPSATVTGAVSGGVATPLPPNYRTRVSFGSPEGGGVINANGATGAYQLGPSWWGPSTTTGDLYALQWQYDATGLPLQYTGFASRSAVSLTDGATLGGQDLTLGAVDAGQLSGALVPAADYTPVSRQLFAVFGVNQALDLFRQMVSDPVFSYLTPAPPGATLLLVARATSASASSTGYRPFATTASGVSIPLPAAASLGTPADRAVGVTPDTTFTWTPTPGGISLLVVRGAATLVVVTTAGSATLSDLTQVGVGIPPDSLFAWYVFGVGPFADLDAAAGAGGYLGPFVQPTTALYQTQSASRELTTAAGP